MTHVLLEKKEHIAVATINRPKALNALNSEVLSGLNELVDIVTADQDIYALVITGSGEKAFVAGADIGEMSTLTKEGGEAFGKHGNDVFRRIETLPIPTIAAVNGFALGGGCELSMSCDIRICSENAVFGQPEVGLGITPGFGGTQRLARLGGAGMAKQLIYTARNIKAPEAFRIGLVNAVYPQEELLPAAEKMAAGIAKNAPIATRTNKGAKCRISGKARPTNCTQSIIKPAPTNITGVITPPIAPEPTLIPVASSLRRNTIKTACHVHSFAKKERITVSPRPATQGS